MAEQTITNPAGAFRSVTSFLTGRDASGNEIDYWSLVIPGLRANAAVAKGEALMWVNATASVPLSVTPMTSAGDKRLFVGVAAEAAAAGGYLRVVKAGFCLANFGAGTPAALDLVVLPATTTGVFDRTATDPDATTVVGTIAGVVFDAKGTDNLAPIWLDPK